MRNTFDIPVIWAAPDDGYFDVIILSPGEELLVDIAKKRCKPFLCHHSREQFPEFYSVIMVNGMAELVKKNRLDIVRVPQYEVSAELKDVILRTVSIRPPAEVEAE